MKILNINEVPKNLKISEFFPATGLKYLYAKLLEKKGCWDSVLQNISDAILPKQVQVTNF